MGVDEVMEVRAQLSMAVVVVAFDGCFFDGPVHPFDLAIGPGMPDLGKPALNALLIADPIEDMVEGIFVVRHIGELDAVVGQHRVDGIRDSSDAGTSVSGVEPLPAGCRGSHPAAAACAYGRRR